MSDAAGGGKLQVEWYVAYVMPNLCLRMRFDSEFVAIVGQDDGRLKAFVSRHPQVAPWLRGFSDTGGRKVRVSAVMVREDAPASYHSETSLASFRNLFALSSIIPALQARISDGRSHGTASSTYFDFHPVVLSREKSDLLTISAAVRGVDQIAGFRGQPDPAISNHVVTQPYPDLGLLNALLGAWDRHVRGGRPRRALQVLFRSLEVAYQAAQLPRSGSMHEYGSRVALWVSAIEILVHPRKGKVDQNVTLGELGKYVFIDRRLRSPRYGRRTQKQAKDRLIQKLCRELYRARHAFVHGNPVTVRKLFPSRNAKLPGLHHIAPLIYRALLDVFMSSMPWAKKLAADFGGRQSFEEALLACRGAAKAAS